MLGNKVFNDDPEQLKSLFHGDNNGNPIPVKTDQNGAVNVIINDLNGQSQNWPTTAFKELRVAQLCAVAGWNFNYNINSDIVNSNTDGTNGTVTQSNSKAILQTSANTNSYAKIETIKPLRYSPGIGALVRCTAVFTIGVTGSNQIIGIGDDDDGFFFGYNGPSFGVMRRQNGTDNWTPQSSWNGEKFDGSGESGINLDQTKGNVYYINYQWLGYGYITFGIENPNTGNLIVVHSIKYANTSTNPNIFNPTLPLMAEVKNTSNNSNIKLETPGAMGFVEGIQTNAITTRNSISANKSGITTKEPILTIKNKANYQSKTNRVRIKLDFLSVSTDGNKTAVIKVLINSTLGGTPIWQDINNNTSVIEYDTNATSVTGGRELMVFELGKVDSDYFLLDSMDLYIGPNNTFTITGESSKATEVYVSISWKELF